MARLTDGAGLPPPSVLHLTDYWWTVLRRTWQGSVVSSLLSPLLYILAMGVVLGGFIEGDPETLEGATTYLAFIAPGLVAAHTMETVFDELTYPVLGMIKWHRTYLGMLATPLRVRDVVNAQLGYVLARVAVVSAIFLAVMAPFGVFADLTGVLLAFLAQVLIGAAFAGPMLAFSAWLPHESGYALVFRLGMIPMFLFSGAFFPVANLGAPLEWLAKATPLWHGVSLTRMLTLDNVDATRALINVAVLVLLAGAGWRLSIRNLHRRLIT
jgi:lipooligosaccharide transport system permease protein